MIFVRAQTPSIRQTAPSVVIQTPSFPSGFPPPRGIGDSPRIMHDKRGCDTHAYRGALTYFERRALPAEIPARGEEFGARKLKPVSTRLYGVARHSKSAPRLSSGGFAACESLAERRVIPSSKKCVRGLRTLRISVVRVQAPSIGRSAPKPRNTITPSCGFPQKSFPPEGPHDFRGHLRRSRKSDIAAEENSSADYATCRHAPRPKGEQRARGCVL